MTLLFLFLLGGRIPLSPVPLTLELNRQASIQVLPGPSFLVANRNGVAHWAATGRVIQTIEPDNEVLFATFVGNCYLVTVAEDGFRTHIYDASGKQLPDIDDLISYPIFHLNKVGIRYYAPLQMDDQFLRKHNYVFLAHEIEFIEKPNGLTLQRTGLRFAKANARMHDLFFVLKKIYLATPAKESFEAPRFLVVNEIENRLYFFDSAHIEKEKIDGQRKPTEIPFLKLDLPNFKPTPTSFFNPGLVVHDGVAEKAMNRAYKQWWNELGLIRWFGRYGDGYVIAYEIPEYDTEGRCTGYHQVITKIDENYEVDQNFQRVKGHVMGVEYLQGEEFLFSIEAPSSTDGVAPMVTYQSF